MQSYTREQLVLLIKSLATAQTCVNCYPGKHTFYFVLVYHFKNPKELLDEIHWRIFPSSRGQQGSNEMNCYIPEEVVEVLCDMMIESGFEPYSKIEEIGLVIINPEELVSNEV